MELRTTFQPELIHPSVYMAPGAIVVGDVVLDARCSIWFNAVVRGDVASIRIGEESNIQDGAILHADPGFPCSLGRRCSVGHGAVVHGAQVGDRVLIGINAIIMNGATIGENSMIIAGAIVREGKNIPPNSLVSGTRGKVLRPLRARDSSLIELTALHYVEAAGAYSRHSDS